MITATKIVIEINSNSVQEDEFGQVWAEVNGYVDELFELVFRCCDQTPAEMLENHVRTDYCHNGEETYIDKIFVDDINKALGLA
jgi:hypothetical protein